VYHRRGAGDSRGHGGFVLDQTIFPLLLRKVYADKDRQEALVNRPARGDVRALTDLPGFAGGERWRLESRGHRNVADAAEIPEEMRPDTQALRRPTRAALGAQC